jgi:hypothetical protein
MRMSAKAIHPSPLTFSRWPSRFCASGDEFVDPRDKFSQVQNFSRVLGTKRAAVLSRDLRRWIGKPSCPWRGPSPFGAHTGHHHAPLMLPITRISIASAATQSLRTAMTTVQAFYAALSAGNGEEAAKLVIPKKRSSGPTVRDRHQQVLWQSSRAADARRCGCHSLRRVSCPLPIRRIWCATL